MKHQTEGGEEYEPDLGRTSGVLRAYSCKEYEKSAVFLGKVRFFREKYVFFGKSTIFLVPQKWLFGVSWGLNVSWASSGGLMSVGFPLNTVLCPLNTVLCPLDFGFFWL